MVIQRVSQARVLVGEKVVGEIGNGLFILLGVARGDTTKDVDTLVEKITKLRIMSDNNQKMNLSILDVSASVLVVSQFTLLADTKKGNRPSFIHAADPDEAKKIYEYFIQSLKESKINVQSGEFGEYMIIDVKLDGPVTITLET